MENLFTKFVFKICLEENLRIVKKLKFLLSYEKERTNVLNII